MTGGMKLTQEAEMDDRFGIADSAIIEVIEEHRGIVRAGCYVPTRREVASKDAAWLAGVLIDWWWESPTALMPTWGQVREVLAILHNRMDIDSPEIQQIIAEAPKAEDFI